MAIGDKNIVKDDFWLNMVAEKIYDSSDRMKIAIDSLQSSIKWAFGVFTTGGFALSFFSKFSDYNSCALVFLGIGFAILTMAYVLSTTAAFPSYVEISTNDVTAIQAAYIKVVKRAMCFFKWAIISTFAGFLSISVGILVQFGLSGKGNNQQISSANMILRTGYESINKKGVIPITVTYAKNNRIYLTIIRDTMHRDTILNENILYTDTSGVCSYCFKIPDSTICKFKVVVAAKDSSQSGIKSISLEKIVKNKL